MRTPLLSASLLGLLGLTLACGGGGGSAPSAPTVTAPAITTQPVSQTVASGSTATLTVAASGTGPLTYQWDLNGTPVPGATAASYTTPALSAIATGSVYTCVVSNSVGNASSAAATITVTPPPSVLVGGFTGSLQIGETPSVWTNGTLAALPGASGQGQEASVRALATSGTDTYAGGALAGLPGYWLNGSWTALALPGSATGGQVDALAVSGTSVYAAGNTSEPANQVGTWQNGTWQALPVPAGYGPGGVNTLALANSTLYVGGYVTTSAGDFAPCLWANGVATVLPIPSATADATVLSVAVSGGHVYACGYGYLAGQSGNLLAERAILWVDGVASVLPVPSGDAGASADSVAVLGGVPVLAGEVYAGSGYAVSGVTVGTWQGGVWSGLSLPSGSAAPMGGPSVVAVSGQSVLVGNGGLAGYWQNGTWTALALPSGITTGGVYTILP